MLIVKGRWMVTTFCCTSGECIECHDRGNRGDRKGRARRVHMDGISKGTAEVVAANWQVYGGQVERMPEKARRDES